MAKKIKKQSGFTLIELMVTMLIASIVIIGISGVIADATKGYKRMYERIHGDIVTDAYVARVRFDKICRMARVGTATVGTSPPTLRVLYYSVPNGTDDPYLPPDRYAMFYQSESGTDLMLDTGTYSYNSITEVTTLTLTGTETVARNVTESSLQFSAPIDGKSVQMVMTLDKDPANDSDPSITVTCGSIMHN